MEDWKDILPTLDVENIRNFALPVRAKRYTINGEIVDIPEYDELVNMVISISDKIAMVKLNKLIEATGTIIAKAIKPIYERLNALEKRLDSPTSNPDLNDDIDKIKDDVEIIKKELFPEDFIKSLIVQPKTEK